MKTIPVCLQLVCSWVYILLFKCHTFLMKIQIKKSFQPSTPMVVVGGRKIGGDGKTPVVIELAQKYFTHKKICILVYNIYNTQSDKNLVQVSPKAIPPFVSDEALMIAQQCNHVVVYGVKNRYRAWQELDTKFDVILSDDGLQDVRLFQAFKICLEDKRNPYSVFKVFPAGTFRPMSPVDIDEHWYHGGQVELMSIPSEVKGNRNILITSIAEPEEIKELHLQAGAQFLKKVFLKDHSQQFPDVMEELLSQYPDSTYWMTEKDLVKLPDSLRKRVDMNVISRETKLHLDEAQLMQRVFDKVQ